MKKLFLFLFVIYSFLFVNCYPQDTFNGCGPEGTATNDEDKFLSRQKNRYDTVTTGRMQTVKAFTFPNILVNSDDRARFDSTKAGQLTGWVYAVKWGSKENCNCQQTGKDNQDVHIELVQTQGTFDKTKVVVVEITPRLRRRIFNMLGLTSSNMSNAALKELLMPDGDTNVVKIKVKGWAMFDYEHKGLARNSNPNGSSINRVSSWELHPVTWIKMY